MSTAATTSKPTVWTYFTHPRVLFYWLAGATTLLLVMGLAMVLSASSYQSQRAYNTPYWYFERQLLFAVIGVALLLLASRFPERLWKWLAWWMYGGAVVGLVAVLFIGVSVHGQRNWISFGGPLRFQPSEFAKFALVVWGAAVLTAKKDVINTWAHQLIPVLPGGLLLIGLVAGEGDLGTAMIMMPILFALFYSAGAPMRLFVTLGIAGLAGIAVLSMTHGYRLARFESWLHPALDPSGKGYQVLQARSALGSGGILGVGLGASRGKWGWLPEAHTDFIFAVVGEELGLIGTVLLLSAFITLAVSMIVLARRTDSNFARIASLSVCAWLLAQALVNIGGVVGLVPVTGIPLPLVSYGGSSLIPALLALGLILSLARYEPNAGGRPKSTSKKRSEMKVEA